MSSCPVTMLGRGRQVKVRPATDSAGLV
jgi:hypothetical protein